MRKIFTLIVALVAMGITSAEAAIVESPVFSLSEGTLFTETQFVDLMCPTEGAEIYYTLDGTEPNRDAFRYEGNSIVVATSTILKAVAYVGDEQSEVAVAQYEINQDGTTGLVANIVKKLLRVRGGHRTITVTSEKEGTIRFFTIGGQEVMTDRTTTIKGSDPIKKIVFEDVAPGIYIVEVDGDADVVVVW